MNMLMKSGGAIVIIMHQSEMAFENKMKKLANKSLIWKKNKQTSETTSMLEGDLSDLTLHLERQRCNFEMQKDT